jgi:hypothetical protein
MNATVSQSKSLEHKDPKKELEIKSKASRDKASFMEKENELDVILEEIW